jgi:MFS family permease
MSLTPHLSRRRSAPKSSLPWTLAIVSLGLLMTTLDNLVVTTALPSIRRSLGASIQSLEWTVNAYMTFAVLLLSGAALGDRLGRRRMFAVGLAIFTVASAGAAVSASTDGLIAARALQGLGAAIVLPLTLTLLSEAVSPARRGMALGIWGGVSGLGVAIGPLVGGAVVSGISWHWIFWINVPVGVVLVPLALTRLGESRGPSARLDPRGLALAAPGLLGITYAAIRGQALGWTSATILISLAGGIGFPIAFVAWELRAPAPMLPMRFFRSRAFAATNGLSFAMYFGVFGSILDLPACPVLSDNAGLLTAAGRPADASLDRHANDRRADRGNPQRPDRTAAADGGRPSVAGQRDLLAGSDPYSGPRLQPPDRPVHAGGRRNGARVRPIRQRGPELRATP